MNVCKKCKWYRRFWNSISDGLPTCKAPGTVTINVIYGNKEYPDCIDKNSDGNCDDYRPRHEPFVDWGD